MFQASLSFVALLPLTCATLSVASSDMPLEPPPVCLDVYMDYTAVQEALWLDLWGNTYEPGKSVVALEAGESDFTWHARVFREEDMTDHDHLDPERDREQISEGSLEVLASYPFFRDLAVTMDPESGVMTVIDLDVTIVAGVLTGTTGVSANMLGLLTKSTSSRHGESENLVHLEIIETFSTTEAAATSALTMAEEVQSLFEESDISSDLNEALREALLIIEHGGDVGIPPFPPMDLFDCLAHCEDWYEDQSEDYIACVTGCALGGSSNNCSLCDDLFPPGPHLVCHAGCVTLGHCWGTYGGGYEECWETVQSICSACWTGTNITIFIEGGITGATLGTYPLCVFLYHWWNGNPQYGPLLTNRVDCNAICTNLQNYCNCKLDDCILGTSNCGTSPIPNDPWDEWWVPQGQGD